MVKKILKNLNSKIKSRYFRFVKDTDKFNKYVNIATIKNCKKNFKEGTSNIFRSDIKPIKKIKRIKSLRS